MHLDFASALNLVSTITVIGALVFTGLQVRAANRARREQAAVTAIQTAALSENSARILELLGEVPENASAAEIDNLNAEARRQILEFGLRLEIIGYMVSHEMVDLQIVNDLGGGAVLGFWSRAKKLVARKKKTNRRGRVFGMVRMARYSDYSSSCYAHVHSSVRASPSWTEDMIVP